MWESKTERQGANDVVEWPRMFNDFCHKICLMVERDEDARRQTELQSWTRTWGCRPGKAGWWNIREIIIISL